MVVFLAGFLKLTVKARLCSISQSAMGMQLVQRNPPQK